MARGTRNAATRSEQHADSSRDFRVCMTELPPLPPFDPAALFPALPARLMRDGLAVLPRAGLHGIAATLCLILTLGAAAPQERYVRAEENKNHDLVITTSKGQRIVLGKSERTPVDQRQTEFNDIAISRDGAAVGWAAYFPNCCTSYTVPMVVEVYSAGKRHTFEPPSAPHYWCFVDGSARVGAISTTLHGPQHAVIELWDIATGSKRGAFVWMEDEEYPGAPAWVLAIRRGARSKTHECTTHQ